MLVTGGAGFIGRHAVLALARQGYEVHATTRRSGPPPVEGVRWHRADLLEPADVARVLEVARPSRLLHAAWLARPGSHGDPENARWVEASLGLLRRFHEGGGKRAVLVGSCFEYDWDRGYCVEAQTPLRPSTVYGTCKQAFGDVARAYGEATGLSTAWARVFLVYGPHENPRRLVPAVATSLLRGEPALCSHGEQVRDYLHVEDVAGALAALVGSAVTGAVNVASGEPVALKDVIRLVAEEVGRPDLVRLGARPTAPNDVPFVLANVDRLREEVGWSPTYSLREGVAQTVRWWRDELADELSPAPALADPAAPAVPA